MGAFQHWGLTDPKLHEPKAAAAAALSAYLCETTAGASEWRGQNHVGFYFKDYSTPLAIATNGTVKEATGTVTTVPEYVRNGTHSTTTHRITLTVDSARLCLFTWWAVVDHSAVGSDEVGLGLLKNSVLTLIQPAYVHLPTTDLGVIYGHSIQAAVASTDDWSLGTINGTNVTTNIYAMGLQGQSHFMRA